MTIKKKTDKFQIFCFGNFSIYFNDLPVNFRCKKADELVAYLIVHDGHPVNKSTMSFSLWENSTEQYSKDSLYKTYAAIKKTASRIGCSPIKSITNKYLLNKDIVYCDLWEFEELYHHKNIINWEKAENLYKGSLFGGEAYSWLVEHEGRYEFMYREIVEYLIFYYQKCRKSTKIKYYEHRLNLLT